MAIKDWKRTRSRRIGNNISIIYKKKRGGLSLELFRDSTWGKNTDNMNVIIRDKNQKSLMSSLGKTILVKYFDMESQATHFAKEYMERN